MARRPMRPILVKREKPPTIINWMRKFGALAFHTEIICSEITRGLFVKISSREFVSRVFSLMPHAIL